jgi:hypothetical protein
MSDLGTVLNLLYERLLLRDLFAKVLPGWIVLLALGIALSRFPCDANSIIELVSKFTLGTWVVAIGLGWIAGFGVQSLGELLGLILYYPRAGLRHEWLYRLVAPREMWPWRVDQVRRLDGDELRRRVAHSHFRNDFESYQCWIPIRRSEKDQIERQHAERLVVIMEACGNSYVALLIVVCLIIVSQVTVGCRTELLLAALGMTAFAGVLGRMHFVHVRRRQEVAAASLRRNVWRNRHAQRRPAARR